jgi:hypothetical protein
VSKQESIRQKEVLDRVITRLLNRHVYMCFAKLSEFAQYQKEKRRALIKVAGHLVQNNENLLRNFWGRWQDLLQKDRELYNAVAVKMSKFLGMGNEVRQQCSGMSLPPDRAREGRRDGGNSTGREGERTADVAQSSVTSHRLASLPYSPVHVQVLKHVYNPHTPFVFFAAGPAQGRGTGVAEMCHGQEEGHVQVEKRFPRLCMCAPPLSCCTRARACGSFSGSIS